MAPKDKELYARNYGNGIPSWSPLYHEDPTTEQSPNLVGGFLLPHSMRVVDQAAVEYGLDVLQGRGTQGGVKLGWSPQETAVGCRIRDYGSGVPHWSPLYGGSEWRKTETATGFLRYKNFKTAQITERPTAEILEAIKKGEAEASVK
jgi:hypothetical protein